ncbi:MAG: SLBB domain-containing protein [Chlorobi bacterium]|nr:SLBB domain-containing protein [Chlorobiota bacterium]MBX7215999.1 SLBB domain-containing protein [Candidatus Kapabacteria bacterium]
MFQPLRLLLLVFPLLLLSVQHRAAAQGGGGQPGGAFGSVYDFTAGAGFSMEVNIWGAVARPGRYKVPSSTTLLQLISYAGGPAAGQAGPKPKLDEVRVVHDLTVDSTVSKPIEVYDLVKYQQTADTTLNPKLYPNDTVIIPEQDDTFNEVLAVIRDVGLVLVSILTIYNGVK